VTAAAPTSSTELRTELQSLLGAFVALPADARRAVVSTVASFIADAGVSSDERALALALVALARATNSSL
jgi:hypothetical protein